MEYADHQVWLLPRVSVQQEKLAGFSSKRSLLKSTQLCNHATYDCSKPIHGRSLLTKVWSRSREHSQDQSRKVYRPPAASFPRQLKAVRHPTVQPSASPSLVEGRRKRL